MSRKEPDLSKYKSNGDLDDEDIRIFDELDKRTSSITSDKPYKATSYKSDDKNSIFSSGSLDNNEPLSLPPAQTKASTKKSWFPFGSKKTKEESSIITPNDENGPRIETGVPLVADGTTIRIDQSRSGLSSQSPFKKKERMFPIYFIVLLVIGLAFIIGGAIGIVIILINPPESPSPTKRPIKEFPPTVPRYPTKAPTLAPNAYAAAARASCEELIAPLYASSSNPLDEPTTCQSRALNWVTFQDPLRTSPGSPEQLVRFSLATLFYCTNGNSWDKRNYWLSSAHVCQWSGITCTTGNGLAAILEIILPRNNLQGKLPLEISLYPNLETLSLHSNLVNGFIPSTIGSLFALRCLELYSNKYIGKIPTQVGSLRHLHKLYLDSNFLTGTMPDEIRNLNSLEDFTLFDNSLVGTLPWSFATLTSLKRLWISGNKFEGTIPTFIENFGKLRYLYLDRNRLTGMIPAFLASLENLHDLRLNNNKLFGCIPVQLFSMESLRVLYLDNNELFCELYSQIYSGPRLKYLELSNNKFNGRIPHVKTDNSVLRVLRVDGNSLTGTLPTSLGRLQKIKKLDFGDNKIEAPIPHELENLHHLEKLLLNNNTIEEKIPDFFPDISALTHLLLHNNSLTGTVPESIGNIEHISFLTLDTNKLSGVIPTILCEENVFVTADSCDKGAPVICECCFCSINDYTKITERTGVGNNLDIVTAVAYNAPIHNSSITFFDENI